MLKSTNIVPSMKTLSIPAVGGHAGGKREQRVRHDPCKADKPSLGGRMGQREDEERVRDTGRFRSDRRQGLTRL
jgi:hypothetical protein